LVLLLLLIKSYNLYRVLGCSTAFFQLSVFCAIFDGYVKEFICNDARSYEHKILTLCCVGDGWGTGGETEVLWEK